jgi:hypothetical protein
MLSLNLGALGVTDEALIKAVLGQLGITPEQAIEQLAAKLGVSPARAGAIQNGDVVQTAQGPAKAVIVSQEGTQALRALLAQVA